MKRIVSVLLSVLMIAGVFSSLPLSASAAKTKAKVSLKKENAKLSITKKKNGKTVYGKTKIVVNKVKDVRIKKITYKSKNSNIAKVSKKGTVTAVKQGVTKINVTVNYKYQKKNNKKAKLTFNVQVHDKRTETPKPVVTPTAPTESVTEIVTVSETVPATEATSAPETTETATNEPSTVAETEAFTTAPPDTTVPSTEVQEETATAYGEGGQTPVHETAEPTAAPEPTEEVTQSFTDETTPAEEETTAETEATTAEETLPAPLTFNEKLSVFSNKLYSLVAARQDKNYIFSPVSVYFALSLLYSVGDDKVKEDIEEFVGMSDEEIKKSGEFFSQLVRKHYYEDNLVGEVSLSNSIWNDITVSDRLSEAKLKELAEEYNAQSFIAPFSTDNDEANKMVTDFVKEQTRGLIDKDFDIPASTIFALINTIYFKDVWNLGSDDLPTEQRGFITKDEIKECEFLKGYYFDGKIQSTDTFDYFYTKMANGYKIKFILPKDGHTLDEVLTSENLYNANQKRDYEAFEELRFEDLTEDEANYYLTNLNEWDLNEFDDLSAIKFNCTNHTRCIFPSFKIDSHTPLYNVLMENGLDSALSVFESDLLESKQPGDNLLVVSDIYQDAVIEVDKSGVKAAAVTIIEGEAGCAPDIELDIDRYFELVMNKNFAFILTNSDDVILFEGKVYDPTV